MKRVLVYSHDTFGLGNVRRMLAISSHLLKSIEGLSILLITGSPVIHSLRLPGDLDYIKLPCLTRTGRGEYSAKYLNSSLEEVVNLRSELILAAVRNFRPDLLVVDKKPLGVKRELERTFDFLGSEMPATRRLLILRDILDRPQAIVSNWERNGHARAIRDLYDHVIVLGQREIFDPVSEYSFPPDVAAKVEFCGYLRKQPGEGCAISEIRKRYGAGRDDRLLLVTAGGGEDGYQLIDACLRSMDLLDRGRGVRTVIVTGPEMPEEQGARLRDLAASSPSVTILEYTSDLVELMAAADGVVSMAGYNTVCEILSLGKNAIVIPRVRPTEEQLIRAERLSALGAFRMIHPDELTPELLASAVERMLDPDREPAPATPIALDALPAIASRVRAMLTEHESA